ncbi:hypothetical protein MCB86_19515 [Pseudomonas sp. KSR10]|uniref:hypothetical protein n=1 Tax=Pseudomonas sp. KSR10 TaxID=2916654 RepID=UPI001EF7DD8E|nr:hypothetical protein [Pseudomonas sp. KSR10]MCG6542265.1 hypothetical protein [Pseudomonas sp. KSR10]
MTLRLSILSAATVFVYLLLINVSLDRICSVFSEVQGYQCNDPNFSITILGCILLMLLALCIPILGRSYSACLLWLMYYFHVVPSILVFSRLNGAAFEDFAIFSSLVFITYFFLVYASRIKVPVVELLYLKPGLNHLLLSACVIFFVFFVVSNLGFNLNPPSIDDVYDVRAEYKSRVTPLVGYLAVLTGYFLSPVFVVLSVVYWDSRLKYKALFFICVASFLSYLIYSSAGFKSVAFMPVVTLLSCLLFRKSENLGLLLNFLFLALLIFAWFLFIAFDLSIVLDHWVRRALVVPGMTVAYFYDYSIGFGFDANGSIPNLISKTYFGTDGSANAGFIGDGIARYGVDLFWINILLLFLFVRLPELLLGKLDGPYIPALFISTAYALSNSSITTVILTYGFLPLIIFVYFYKRVLVK